MGDVKTRMVLEGEQQYRTAMTDAANAIKVLNSQQKLATAQFKNTGDAEKYAQQQTEILKQKIAQQKTAVDAAAKALKELSNGGVKENSRQFQQWQQKLSNAQTQLTNMETELKNVTESMQNTTTYAEDTATAVESIGKKVSFDAVIGGMDKITGAMAATARKAKELTLDLFQTTRNAAAWADDLATNAIVYGFDVETLQGMRLAAELFDTSVEAIVKSRQKLENNIVYGSTDVEDAFAALRVPFESIDSNGRHTARNIEDIYWDVGNALMVYGDEIERDAMANKIFGRSWRELLPMFKAGREAYDQTVESASKASDEQVEKLTALDDAIQKLTYEWSVTKNTLSAELAPAFTAVSNALTGAMKEFNQYLQTEEGQQKLADLSKAVKDLFSGLTNTDFGAALDTSKKALDTITNGLGWIKDNKDGIVDALKGIAIGFLALKLASVGLEIGKTVSGLKGLFGGGGGNNTTTPTAPTPTAPKGTPVTGGPKGFRLNIPGAENAAIPVSLAQGLANAGTFAALTYGSYKLADAWNKGEVQEAVIKAFERAAENESNAPFVNRDAGWDLLMKGIKNSPKNTIPMTLNVPDRVDTSQINETREYFAQARKSFEEVQESLRAMYMGKSPIGKAYEQIGGAWSSGKKQGEVLQDLASRYGPWLNGETDEAFDALIDAIDESTADRLYAMLETFYQKPNGEWDTTGLDPYDVAGLFEQMSAELEKQIKENPPKLELDPDIEAVQKVLNGAGLTVPLTPYFRNIGSAISAIGHANGLPYVPFDGYPAILHKGERVVPARENANYSSNLYVESMIMNGGADVNALAESMAAAQRRQSAGYGS